MAKKKVKDYETRSEKERDEIDQTPEEFINESASAEAPADEAIVEDKGSSEETSDDEEVKKLKKENKDLQEKYLRLYAEFENFKKRMARERIDMINTAGQELMVSLLPVMDDFERAMEQLEKTDADESLIKGVELILNKLRNILQQKGLKEMESIGKEFDPEYHEAITEMPAQNKKQKGKVIDEVEKGYYLNDKIIRHAKVIIGK